MTMGNKRSYYDILGLTRDTEADDLKAAYRKLARQYHPDANNNSADAEVRMKEINEAYDVLSDPKKRDEYDRGLTPDRSKMRNSGAFYGGFGDNKDINFNDLFGGTFDEFFNRGNKKREPSVGCDVSINININPDEAVSGTEKEIAFDFLEVCGFCNGSEVMAGITPDTCKRCNGSGQERITTQSAFGKMTQLHKCTICQGSGKVPTESCQKCFGRGFVKLNKKISVKIPKGINSGKHILIRGMGEPGKHGGLRGDLLIKVLVRHK